MISALFNLGWLKDLGVERYGIRAKQTGQLIRWDAGNLIAASRGLTVHLMVWLLRLGGQFQPGREYAIAFTPIRPSPWYLIWSVIHAGKGKIVSDPAKADALFFFEDNTRARPKADGLASRGDIRAINAGCDDISKSTVARVFAEVFGYSLAIDPTKWQGAAVEKSEENGAHDGRIVQCPIQPKPGKSYEKLILNSDNGATVLDYRSPTIGGQIPLVFVKERPINQRFANSNTKVRLADPKNLFLPEELQKISQFCRRMGLDFGGLDVLRNREDGKIYVVDVNKTDMGPPTSLPFIDQFRALRKLAAVMRQYIILGPRAG